MLSTTRLRNFVWTLHNYTKEDEEAIQSFAEERAQYCVYGREICPTTGTPHLQGYTELLGQTTFKKIKDTFPRMRLDRRRGTAMQASVYCIKDGDYWDFGEMKCPGKRTDIDKVRADLREGINLKELTDTCLSYQSIQIAKAWLVYNEPERDFITEVYWYWGPTGSGKTTAVAEECKNEVVFWHNTGTKWFDGYDAHPIMILDDLRRTHFAYEFLLRLFDSKPLRLEIKGGFRSMLSRKIYVTSPLPPVLFDNGEDVTQLLRRITVIKEFGGKA